MRTFIGIDELRAATGEHLGYSGWHVVDPKQVDQFAEVTGDHQWIHTDPERAPAGGPAQARRHAEQGLRVTLHSVGIVGGTGALGRGLARRFARAGHAVTLGSRCHRRAALAAEAVDGHVRGAVNSRAAQAGDVVVLAIPWDAYRDVVTGLRDELAGRIVVSCASPPDLGDGSAAEATALLLPDSRVVAAFHHLSAGALAGDADDQDVLVCGDDVDAKGVVLGLAAAVTGRPGVDAGPLQLARRLETFTAVLTSVNRRYQAHSGIAVTGLPLSRPGVAS